MNKLTRYLTITVLLTIAAATYVTAHCQVPCGIYDDEAEVALMYQHVKTITKAMKQIEADANANQTTRWVMNKEKHADALIDISANYFLAQRIKPDMEHYETNLKTLHGIIVHAMKAKQTTDVANAEKLNELIHKLEHDYFGEKHQH